MEVKSHVQILALLARVCLSFCSLVIRSELSNWFLSAFLISNILGFSRAALFLLPLANSELVLIKIRRFSYEISPQSNCILMSLKCGILWL